MPATKTGADLVRPMTKADIGSVVKIARRAYGEDIAAVVDHPGLEPWADSAKNASSDDRLDPESLARHILKHDPDTCLVAEVDGKINGALLAINREGLIVISMLAVRPKVQRQGFGQAIITQLRALLDNHRRSLAVVRAADTIRTMFPWNFDVHPAMRAAGAIDRSALPRLRYVREGDEHDRDLLEGLDRRLRGASRGVDHDIMQRTSQLFIAEDNKARGYAYAHSDGSPLTVSATSTSLARELLTACLASGRPADTPMVRNLTGEQRWAFDIVRRLGMDLHLAGPVIVRGIALPAPYLPHDALG